MAEPQTSRITNWNLEHALDDPLHAGYVYGAIQKIDADVLHIPETFTRSADDELVSPDQWSAVQTAMGKLGYQGIMTGGVRPDLVATMWSRVGGELSFVSLGEDRGWSIPKLHVPGVGRFFGIHAPSDKESTRLEIAHAFVDHLVKHEINQANAAGEGIAKIADDNTVDPSDSAFARALHIADPFMRLIPGVSGMNYYEGAKLKQKAGVVIRAAGMANGESLRVYKNAGLKDAAAGNVTGTVYLHGRTLRVDRILTCGFDVTDYAVLSAPLDRHGKRLSDHNPVAVTVTANGSTRRAAGLKNTYGRAS